MRDLISGWAMSVIVWAGQIAGRTSSVPWEPITIAGVAGVLLVFVLRTFERMQSDQKSDREMLITVIRQNTESNVRMESKMEDVLRVITEKVK